MTDNTIDDVSHITNMINNFSDDPIIQTDTKNFKLGSTKQFVTNINKESSFDKDKKFYLPKIEINDVICVDFSGIGSELNDRHYAVVLNSNLMSDTITILPLTSFKEEATVEDHSKFSIGALKNKNKKSVVLFNQITTVSRKRIQSILIGGNKVIKINENQKNKIILGLEVNILKRKYLFDELIKNLKRIPVFNNLDVQSKHLKYPFQKNTSKSNQDLLVYSMSGDTNEYEIQLVKYNKNLSRTDRKKLLNKIYRIVPTLNEDGTIQKDRTQVLADTYSELIQHIDK